MIGIAVLASGLGLPVHAQTDPGTTVHAVSYVEVVPAARSTMAAALSRYREASRQEIGHVRIDVLEQVGRPGHFAVVETWTDQAAFDAHGVAEPAEQLRAGLESIRVSGYDERLYTTLTAAPARPAGGEPAVHVVAHVDIAGTARAEAPGLLTRLAEASRTEPGCLRFDVVQQITRTNHFTVLETWESQAALDAHAAAQHTRQYRDVVQPMTGSPLDERVYTAVP